MSDHRAPRHAQHTVIFRPSSLHTIMTPAPHAVPVVSSDFPHYSFAGTAHRTFLFISQGPSCFMSFFASPLTVTTFNDPGSHCLSMLWLVWFHQWLGVDATRFERRQSDPEKKKNLASFILPDLSFCWHAWSSQLLAAVLVSCSFFALLYLMWLDVMLGVRTAVIIIQFTNEQILKYFSSRNT